MLMSPFPELTHLGEKMGFYRPLASSDSARCDLHKQGGTAGMQKAIRDWDQHNCLNRSERTGSGHYAAQENINGNNSKGAGQARYRMAGRYG